MPADQSSSCPRWSRRSLFKMGGVAFAGSMAPGAIAQGRGEEAGDARPRNIIFMVSDGMSAGVPSLAQPFSQLARSRKTTWHQLASDPRTVHGLADMASLDSLVTDSAAASTSWGSGSRVFNGAINQLPDGASLTPIAQLVKQSGRAVGLVTTCTVTHATPAGFAAVQKTRDDESAIAPQYLNLVDVILGGGSSYFDGRLRADKRDLIREFTKEKYALWRNRGDMLQARTPQRVLGLFAQGHMPYTIDHQRDTAMKTQVPTLAEMTRAALAALAGAPKGFLLQVEGGRVDHAAHANDAAALLWDQLAFDDAIAAVMEFQQTHPDTLVIITTDHGNSNPGLNGMGSMYRGSDECFARLAGTTGSYALMSDKLKELSGGAKRPPADLVIDVIRATTQIEVERSEADVIAAAVAKEAVCELNKQHASAVGVLGEVLGNHTGIGWTGTTHTADLVLLMATGPGADQFAGLQKNTDAFTNMCGLMGITHRNASMTREAARKFKSSDAESGPDE